MGDRLSAIIIGASSDIGTALVNDWINNKWKVFGTYRTSGWGTKKNGNEKKFVRCDISDLRSIKKACDKLKRLCRSWDILVICPASLKPIGPFDKVGFNSWDYSIKINFTNQMRIVHELLPSRNIKSKIKPCVLFFSGGGINEAPINSSAYTVSKIATMKMCELLDAENKDTRFAIIGPGWVKTKIHKQMIRAGSKAGLGYYRTLDKFKKDEFTPMERVVRCCNWIIGQPKKIVSGRNFSVVYDSWGSKELSKKLAKETNLFKLRKYGSINKK